MKAIILAAGEGTRLRPLTMEMPKPMLPLGGRPLITYLIELLRAHGVVDIAVNLHHKPEALRAYLGDGSRFGARLTYSFEETLLGSAGAVKRLEGFFDEPFFVVYGDVLTDIDLTALAARHRRSGALLTIALHKTQEPQRCGIAEIDDDGMVSRFIEKPAPGEATSTWANAGVCVAQPAVAQFIPEDSFFDFGNDLIPLLLGRREPVCGYISNSYFLDIGSIERYEQAERDLMTGAVRRIRPSSLIAKDGPQQRNGEEHAASTSTGTDQLSRRRNGPGGVLRLARRDGR